MVYVVNVVVEQLRGSSAKLRYFFYWDGLINVKSNGLANYCCLGRL